MNYKIITLFIFGLFLFQCKNEPKATAPTPETTEVTEPGEKIGGTNPLPQKNLTLITFYDFNAQRSFMDYRRVKIKESSGDAVRDAVNTFLRQHRVGGNLNKFRLDRIKMENDLSIFMISGLSKLKNDEFKPLFKTALDSTIIYNYPNKKFKVIVNGETL